MEIDSEPSVDQQYLANLIKEATTKETKALKKELASVREEVKLLKNPKNKPQNFTERGHTSAFDKKENGREKTRKQSSSTGRRTNNSNAGPISDITPEKSCSDTRRGKQKSKKKDSSNQSRGKYQTST
eukprot:11082286-Ditylum_brightwellii.AAC.1